MLTVVRRGQAPGGTGTAATPTSTASTWATRLAGKGCTGIAGRTTASP